MSSWRAASSASRVGCCAMCWQPPFARDARCPPAPGGARARAGGPLRGLRPILALELHTGGPRAALRDHSARRRLLGDASALPSRRASPGPPAFLEETWTTPHPRDRPSMARPPSPMSRSRAISGATRHLVRSLTGLYVSGQRIRPDRLGLPPGGAFRHSQGYRTVFAADEVLYVLSGVMVIADPETGEVHRVLPGEAAFFRRDTSHHVFDVSTDQLRVLEMFAPPPARRRHIGRLRADEAVPGDGAL